MKEKQTSNRCPACNGVLLTLTRYKDESYDVKCMDCDKDWYVSVEGNYPDCHYVIEERNKEREMIKVEYYLSMDSEDGDMDITISYPKVEDINAFVELVNDCLPNNMGLYKKND
jgi:hypothetical protein